jgi:hypothetical protein
MIDANNVNLSSTVFIVHFKYHLQTNFNVYSSILIINTAVGIGARLNIRMRLTS